MLSQKVKFSSFLQLSRIPLCKYPIGVLSTHLLMYTWLHPFLVIENNLAMNIGVLMFFQAVFWGFIWIYSQRWDNWAKRQILI